MMAVSLEDQIEMAVVMASKRVVQMWIVLDWADYLVPLILMAQQ